jgi:hypothetical protein
MNNMPNPQSSTAEDFWGELAPVENSIQLYASHEKFLKTLEIFVCAGLRSGESVVVITTQAHRTALEKRLKAGGIDLAAAKAGGEYLALDAWKTQAAFWVNDFPDEILFKNFVTGLLARAHQTGARVRVFSEMTALLWMQGHRQGMARLEQLWTVYCQEGAFSLFCAYPRSGLTLEVDAALVEISATHARVFAEHAPHFVSYEVESGDNPPIGLRPTILGDRLVGRVP